MLEQLADRATGGIVAAPEMDEAFVESGGYGFVWPRDLAYVVLGLLAVRCDDAAAAALRWLARVQAPEGLWLHRYWTTGKLLRRGGSTRSTTGVALLVAEAAFREIGDEELDRELWPTVRRAAELLVSFVDPATGLPRASTDLWEQHDGQHAYSTAAVAGGLCAASLTAARHEPGLGRRYVGAADRVVEALDAHLWDDELGRYRRAVNVARRDGAGGPAGVAFEHGLPYPNRRVAGVDPVDGRLDCALLGLAWPFGPLGLPAERVRATVDAVEAASRRRREDCAATRATPTAVGTSGRSRRCGSASPAARSATARRARGARARRRPPNRARPAPGAGPRRRRPRVGRPLGWAHSMLLVAARPELELIRTRQEDGAGDGRGG